MASRVKAALFFQRIKDRIDGAEIMGGIEEPAHAASHLWTIGAIAVDRARRANAPRQHLPEGVAAGLGVRPPLAVAHSIGTGIVPRSTVLLSWKLLRTDGWSRVIVFGGVASSERSFRWTSRMASS